MFRRGLYKFFGRMFEAVISQRPLFVGALFYPFLFCPVHQAPRRVSLRRRFFLVLCFGVVYRPRSKCLRASPGAYNEDIFVPIMYSS